MQILTYNDTLKGSEGKHKRKQKERLKKPFFFIQKYNFSIFAKIDLLFKKYLQY